MYEPHHSSSWHRLHLSLRRLLVTPVCLLVALIALWIDWIRLAEMFSRGLVEIIWSFLGWGSSPTYGTRQSAVLVIGVGNGESLSIYQCCTFTSPVGAGRYVATRFSELGYTVFVLCRKSTDDTSTPQIGLPSDVASVGLPI
jgi:hypothetical protein